MLEGGELYCARTELLFFDWEEEESESSSLEEVEREGEEYLGGGVGVLGFGGGGGRGLGVRGFLGCSITTGGGGLGFSFSFLTGMGRWIFFSSGCCLSLTLVGLTTPLLLSGISAAWDGDFFFFFSCGGPWWESGAGLLTGFGAFSGLCSFGGFVVLGGSDRTCSLGSTLSFDEGLLFAGTPTSSLTCSFITTFFSGMSFEEELCSLGTGCDSLLVTRGMSFESLGGCGWVVEESFGGRLCSFEEGGCEESLLGSFVRTSLLTPSELLETWVDDDDGFDLWGLEEEWWEELLEEEVCLEEVISFFTCSFEDWWESFEEW